MTETERDVEEKKERRRRDGQVKKIIPHCARPFRCIFVESYSASKSIYSANQTGK